MNHMNQIRRPPARAVSGRRRPFRLRSMALGCVLAVATPAWALNHDGSNGGPSSLFLSVLDPLTQTSYYRDLQVTYRQFLDNPALTLDLAGDSRFADLLGKDGLLFNIAAFHRLSADGANLSSWGYLLTHTGSRADLAGDFVSIDAVRQRMQIYASQLTDTAGTFHAGEAGYFDGDNWGASLGGLVGGSTVGHPGQPVAFYRVNNNTGDVAGGRVEQLGSWLLTRDGKLSFDRTASGNLPPQAGIAGPGAARVGETVILDGSGSRDQDQGPEPLRHAWIRLSGPLATLENPQSPKAGFTPAQPGRYRFRLTVGDGEANASATLDIAVEAAANQAPVVQLETRLSGRVGQRVTLDGSRSYDPDNVPGPLRFQWTPSGGPATTLAGAESAQASFTPDLPGDYRFGLTVSDGDLSSQGWVDVAIAGPDILTLRAPGEWVVGVAQRIAWTTRDVAPKRAVRLQYSRDGVNFKTLGSVAAGKGGFRWKPKQAQASETGVLRACVKPRSASAWACDDARIVVRRP